MKSRVYFTKYFLNTLLECEDLFEPFFYKASKLSINDLRPVVYIDSNNYLQVEFIKALHKTLQASLIRRSQKLLKGEISGILGEEYRKGETELFNIMRPIYAWIREERELENLMVPEPTPLLGQKIKFKVEDLIRDRASAISAVTDREYQFGRGFYCINRRLYWKKSKVYE